MYVYHCAGRGFFTRPPIDDAGVVYMTSHKEIDNYYKETGMGMQKGKGDRIVIDSLKVIRVGRRTLQYLAAMYTTVIISHTGNKRKWKVVEYANFM